MGEHAVVYGKPAIAAPISTMRAYADAQPSDAALNIRSIELGKRVALQDPLVNDSARPMQQLLQLAVNYFCQSNAQGDIVISSGIPIAGGLGSGAAVAAAAFQAMAGLFGRIMPLDDLNWLVYEMEKIHHGKPSGIDNTVVVYEQPVYFERGKALELLAVKRRWHFLIADSGRAASTRAAVERVRQRYRNRQQETEANFQSISKIVRSARLALERGRMRQFGDLMNENHQLLQELGVSSRELDALVEASISAGALGAKLSGGGMGGNIIVLPGSQSPDAIRQALRRAGAVRVIDFILD